MPPHPGPLLGAHVGGFVRFDGRRRALLPAHAQPDRRRSGDPRRPVQPGRPVPGRPGRRRGDAATRCPLRSCPPRLRPPRRFPPSTCRFYRAERSRLTPCCACMPVQAEPA